MEVPSDHRWSIITLADLEVDRGAEEVCVELEGACEGIARWKMRKRCSGKRASKRDTYMQRRIAIVVEQVPEFA